ncbi:MAG: hypothetical protein QXG39_00330 [Candidatus Aenigmatarchaeota archaeon]
MISLARLRGRILLILYTSQPISIDETEEIYEDVFGEEIEDEVIETLFFSLMKNGFIRMIDDKNFILTKKGKKLIEKSVR